MVLSHRKLTKDFALSVLLLQHRTTFISARKLSSPYNFFLEVCFMFYLVPQEFYTMNFNHILLLPHIHPLHYPPNFVSFLFPLIKSDLHCLYICECVAFHWSMVDLPVATFLKNTDSLDSLYQLIVMSTWHRLESGGKREYQLRNCPGMGMVVYAFGLNTFWNLVSKNKQTKSLLISALRSLKLRLLEFKTNCRNMVSFKSLWRNLTEQPKSLKRKSKETVDE